MRIVHVCNHYSPCLGGMERVVLDISKAFAEKGHEVKVVALDRCANSREKLLSRERVGRIDVERIPFLDLKYYKIALGVLGRIRGADIVHVHGIGFFSDFLIATKWLHRRPIVVSTHGGFFHTESIGSLKKFYFGFIQRALLRFANRVIAVSRNDLGKFRQIARNVTLVQNGVNTSLFRPGNKEGESFLFLGRFSRNKRVEKLLEAFAIVKKTRPGFRLLIAGPDWEHLMNGYKKRVNELGLSKNVVFILNPGNEEAYALYSVSRYFVSASRYEGFGLGLVEAMASGCIPIVQKNDGFSNILVEGKSGFFADFDSSEAAAEKILAAMEGGDRVGRAAVKRSKAFSWGNSLPELEKIYMKEGLSSGD